ncbi:hypothetical protein FNH13_02245 [Ornithinimicrobium ciconiae]|uniref:Uncharacterized protein n=1 Tax=Ornithinimicrobium ciconiae TaxID=2594265 RepID=A0A516G6Y5_9MICO|nr:hypothetical protein [Ornithinimicrobium ciconiae]QDO87296.1 hypothetical protein FNH13_02245 [Ornithinimicrobium ciconiae]
MVGSTDRGTVIMMSVVGVIFVALGVFLWFFQPQARPVAVAAILFFGACLAVGLLQLQGGRLSRVVYARLMGAVTMLMGVGCAALGLVAWRDHNALDRGPWQLSVAVGVIGLIFFGGGGLLLMIRGGRPFGVDADGFRR